MIPEASVVGHAQFIHSVVEGNGNGKFVDRTIARSWARCLQDYHLDPIKEKDPLIVANGDLTERQARLGRLLEIAEVEIANLYQQITGSGYAIMLTDKDGVVVHYLGDPSFQKAARQTGLTVGGNWSEEHQGTNGMGTCLVERKSVVVHRGEHFYARNTGLTCSGAPIFDPHGNLLAALDASGSSRLAQQHTMVLVSMSAQMIENRAFLGAFTEHFVIRFHSRPEFVNTLGEGAIAFDVDGRVLAANRSALFQLGYETPEGLRGRRIDELFSVTVSALLQQAWNNPLHPLPIHEYRDGRRFFALVLPPGETPRNVSVAAAARASGSLRPNRRMLLDQLEIGDAQMIENVRRAKRVLDKNIPILLFGETGSGKGLFARAIHEAGARQDKSFVAINCAAIPESLIESELFGYRPGAFTGASREGRRGKIPQANGGTLFLDEIGDMPLSLQARLLRVLEEKEVVPLGSETPLAVDIRIISATHYDLKELILKGKFRTDLFYRLQGLSLALPPLRERHDRRRLITALAKEENSGNGPVIFDDDALDWLDTYAWPGNIRQLRSVLRTMLALRGDNRIRRCDIPAEMLGEFALTPAAATPVSMMCPTAPERTTPLEVAEQEALLRVLEQNRWNISSAAKQLNLSRNTLYRKMKRHSIATLR